METFPQMSLAIELCINLAAADVACVHEFLSHSGGGILFFFHIFLFHQKASVVPPPHTHTAETVKYGPC